MTIFSVSDSAQLVAAFNAAQGGDRIELAAGFYGYTKLVNRHFASDITITSADPNNRAVFGTMLGFNNVAGVNVTDIDLVEQQLAKNTQQGLLNVWYSRDVTFTDIRIQGHIPTAVEGVDPLASTTSRNDIIAGYGYGTGIRLTNNSDITMTNVEISDFFTAISAGDLFNSKFTGIDIHDVREGVDIFDIDTLEISDSYFHDFKPWVFSSGGMQDHPDMIQYWGVNSSFGVHNLTIDNNLFYQPTGWTQTIFGHLRGAAAGVTATNFTITDNVIVNGHTNAIRPDNVDGFTIANNLILPNSLSPNSSTGWPRILLVNDTNGNVTGNVGVVNWNNTLLNLDSTQLAQVNIATSGNLGLSRSPTSTSYWGPLLNEALNIYHAGGSYAAAVTSVPNGAAAPNSDLNFTISHDGPSGSGHWLDADGSGTLTAGDTVTFIYTLTNAGNVALTDISFADDLTGATAALFVGLTDADGGGQTNDLAKGATATAIASYVIRASDAGTTLTLHASADSSATAAAASVSLDVAATPDPELVLVFGHDGPAAAGGTGTFLDADGSGTLTAGDTVTFTYGLTNTGNVALTDIHFADSLTGANAALLAGLSDTDGDGLADDLAVGASAIARLGHVIGPATGGTTLGAVLTASSAETAPIVTTTSFDIARTITGQMEAGVVTLSQADETRWTSITFTHSITDARVVFGPLSAGGRDPAGIRVRNVTDQGFEFQIDEWDYLDDKHTAETVSWLAVSAGTHTLASGQVISAGRLGAADSLSTTVALTGFAAAPAIFAQVSSAAGPEAVTTRVNGVSQTGFSLHLQEEEAGDDRHAPEAVDWVAVSYGTAGETDVMQATLTHRWKALSFDPQTDEFAFIAGMQTENQADTALLRYSSLTESGVCLMIDEETSLDNEIAHASETVAHLTLETGFLDLYA